MKKKHIGVLRIGTGFINIKSDRIAKAFAIECLIDEKVFDIDYQFITPPLEQAIFDGMLNLHTVEYFDLEDINEDTVLDFNLFIKKFDYVFTLINSNIIKPLISLLDTINKDVIPPILELRSGVVDILSGKYYTNFVDAAGSIVESFNVDFSNVSTKFIPSIRFGLNDVFTEITLNAICNIDPNLYKYVNVSDEYLHPQTDLSKFAKRITNSNKNFKGFIVNANKIYLDCINDINKEAIAIYNIDYNELNNVHNHLDNINFGTKNIMVNIDLANKDLNLLDVCSDLFDHSDSIIACKLLNVEGYIDEDALEVLVETIVELINNKL